MTVFAETATVTEGIAVLREAVIRGANGEDVVFVHVATGLSEPGAVRIEGPEWRTGDHRGRHRGS